MKSVNLKKLALSVAIASAATWGFSAVAENTNVTTQTDYQRSETHTSTSIDNPAPDRNITNPNVDDGSTMNSSTMDSSDSYTNRSESIESRQSEITRSETPVSGSDSTTTGSNQLADVEHETNVEFEPNSVTLNSQAERELEKVVQQLDKSKPVALIVAVEGMSQTGSQQSSSAGINQDSSAGFPGSESSIRDNTVAGSSTSPTEMNGGLGDRNSTSPSVTNEAVQSQQEDRAHLISMYRAENIRDYLEEKGVEVVQWNLESESADSQAIGVTNLEGRNGAESQADIQQIRVVVTGDIEPEGLSAL